MKQQETICKDCYGRRVIYQTNGFTGITTVSPCKRCRKEPESNKEWKASLINKLAKNNQMTEEQVVEFIGV